MIARNLKWAFLTILTCIGDDQAEGRFVPISGGQMQQN